MKRKKSTILPPWTPFVPGTIPDPSQEEIDRLARDTGASVAQVSSEIARLRRSEVWLNSRYQVAIRRPPAPEGEMRIITVSIKRLDKRPVGPERFRDFQRIKNELIGEEYEAVEIYPAEDRLVDTSNQYWLWVVDDPTFRWPFGFDERMIIRESTSTTKQQPFEE